LVFSGVLGSITLHKSTLLGASFLGKQRSKFYRLSALGEQFFVDYACAPISSGSSDLRSIYLTCLASAITVALICVLGNVWILLLPNMTSPQQSSALYYFGALMISLAKISFILEIMFCKRNTKISFAYFESKKEFSIACLENKLKCSEPKNILFLQYSQQFAYTEKFSTCELYTYISTKI